MANIVLTKSSSVGLWPNPAKFQSTAVFKPLRREWCVFLILIQRTICFQKQTGYFWTEYCAVFGSMYSGCIATCLLGLLAEKLRARKVYFSLPSTSHNFFMLLYWFSNLICFLQRYICLSWEKIKWEKYSWFFSYFCVPLLEINTCFCFRC